MGKLRNGCRRKKKPIANKVAHLTTVHDPRDPRITYKECATLAQAGYSVTLVAPGKIDDSPVPGVEFSPLPIPRNRLDRLLKIQFHAARAIIQTGAKAVHFHDPELLPMALCMKLFGWKIIYDIHEDYSSSIRAKSYLPEYVRFAAGMLIEFFEKIAYKTCGTIIAESYYGERFPDACRILNYPLINKSIDPQYGHNGQRTPSSGLPRLLYTGNVTAERGAYLYADIIKELKDVEVWLIGKCNGGLAEKLWEKAGKDAHRLKIIGVDRYVPKYEMDEIVSNGNWLAGLAVFPYDAFYDRTEPTKFFEYMQKGLPIIVSDFPVWRKVVEKEKTGIAVSPDDPMALADAVAWLRDAPDMVYDMGKAGFTAVRERYNWNTQGLKMLEYYQKVL